MKLKKLKDGQVAKSRESDNLYKRVGVDLLQKVPKKDWKICRPYFYAEDTLEVDIVLDEE